MAGYYFSLFALLHKASHTLLLPNASNRKKKFTGKQGWKSYVSANTLLWKVSAVWRRTVAWSTEFHSRTVFNYHCLASVCQEVRNPSVCFAPDAIVVQFVYQEAVVDFIESLRKVHHYDISLGSHLQMFREFISKLQELSLA